MEQIKAKTGKISVNLRQVGYILIILFFICIVAIYYSNLYNATRQDIIDRGRINAIESSYQIDKNMMTAANVLEHSVYDLNIMLNDNRSNEDILAYLKQETRAAIDSLSVETTGIYAYINEEYLDGAGWIPEEGYDPRLRPWYACAQKGRGKMVVVDPYQDMETGEIAITLAQTLSDGESVVAVDLMMNKYQNIIEKNVQEGRSFSEFIVNDKGVVIAHSDKTRIGTDLSSGNDRLSLAVAEKVHSYESGYFYLDHSGRDYLIYSQPLEHGWTCVSVIDATDEFSRLRIPLILTIIIAVMIIGGFLILIGQTEKKGREAIESNLRSEQALAANEAKSAFLSNMSHEIRTPINAVLGMNEMILRECDDKEILVYAENVKAAGNTLLNLINDVLDFSKIEAGKLSIVPTDYDLSSVINDLVTMISPRAEEKDLSLKLDFDPETPKYLHGDEIRIKQIITNLLTNAVKYTESGGITFRIGCGKIGRSKDKVILKVSVIDTGIGIKEEDMQRLFSKFERLEEQRNRNIEGTGLGMSISKNLLSLMGSELSVGSVYGEGSVFSFLLKQDVVKWEPLGDYRNTFISQMNNREKYREKFTAPDATVLVVDDNLMNITVFKNLIKKTRVKTDSAMSGDEGISLSLDRKYDIIFLDHMMPQKDGIETLKEMKAEKESPNIDTPVICLTANAISGAKQQYLEAGFDDYISKPIDAEELEDMLISYLPDSKVQRRDRDGENEAEEEESLPEVIRNCQLIDCRKGLKNSGDPGSYTGLLHIFYDSIDEKTEELDTLYNAEDWPAFAIKAHALKSSARIIGAELLGDEAQRMEDAGKSGDADYIRNHYRSFREDHLKFKEVLSGLFEKKENPGLKPVAAPERMKKAYEEIRKAAEDMDSYELDRIFEEMDKYSIPEAEEELFSRIKTEAGKFNYDEVTQALEER